MADTKMEPTVYGCFEDATMAEKAVGALIDHGVRPEHISLIVSEEYQRRRGTSEDPELDYTHNQTVVREHDPLNTLDPLNNQMRDTPIQIDPAPNRHDLGPGMELLDMNPAQDDYPRSGTGGASELSSAPPSAPRDYNRGLENDDYNRTYRANVDRENEKEWNSEAETREVGQLMNEDDEGLDVNRVDKDAIAKRDVDRTVGPDAYDPEAAAKHGVTTTTIEDAGEGAKKGALWGLGVGTLAAVAALAVPGYGIILGGGALAAAIATMAAGAGAGAVAGGVVGYLKDQGVPAEDIPHYQRAVDGGGALIAVHMSSEENRADVEAILRKYGASRTNRYGYAA